MPTLFGKDPVKAAMAAEAELGSGEGAEALPSTARASVLAGPAWCVNRAAKKLGVRPILESTVTETFYLAVALVIGYLVGHFSVTMGGISFALGTSAGCMLAGIIFSFLRTRNPALGGPMSEGARSFVQDIGLNLFIAVLAANVGPKVLDSLQGTVVIWIAVLGLLGAFLPPLLECF